MKIFLAHAKEDEAITESIYDRLKDAGYNPWMDVRDIPGGVSWDYEIQKNFSNANLIILILSKISAQKNGYVRREFNEALDKLKYVKPDDVFVIPLLIDDSPVPSYISTKIEFIDLKRDDGWSKLEKSLQIAASQQNFEVTQGVPYGPFILKSENFKEFYKKTPGHEIEISYPKIESKELPKSANIITNYFSGRASGLIFSNRTSPLPWDGTPFWNEENESTYISFYNEGFNIAYCNGRVISILHGIHWYGAGAAHPNSNFETSNFLITPDDYAVKFSLHDFFIADKSIEAIEKIKLKILSESSREFWEKTGEKPDESDMKWFRDGISGSDLSNFTVNSDGFTFHFSPYEIHCYALGPWQFFISYYEVIDMIRIDGIFQAIRS